VIWKRAAKRQRGYLPGKGEAVRLRVILEASEEGGYTVIVPSLPGCISEGRTREEALRNIEEAIALYLEPVEDDWAASGNAELVEISV
jgi:predicted RNase H-like HicB family nuclease